MTNKTEATLRLQKEKSRTTVIFVAGWEGTGHNFFDKVFMITGSLKVLLQDNWNQWAIQKTGNAWSSSDTDKNIELLREKASEYPGQVLVVPAAQSGSYPNGYGSHEQRIHQQPNINLLAEAAKEADVDLKVLVTRRSAEETLVATCMHRSDLEVCDTQAETLAENMKVLVQQLHDLDTDAYQCVNYGDLEDLGRGLAYALAYADRDADAAIRSAWAGDSHHDPSADEAEIKEKAKPMLGPLKDLDDLCAKTASPEGTLLGAHNTDGISPQAWRIIRNILPARYLLEAESRRAAA